VRLPFEERWARIAIGATGAALILFGGAAYAYDSTRDDLITEGVTVAGVDLGGLHEGAARAKLQANLDRRLERPVRVAVAGRRVRLPAKRAELAPDVDAMVRAAVERSRKGGLPGRLWRDLTNRHVEDDLTAEVHYSSLEVRRFIRRVQRVVNRPPRDADVKFTTASLPAIPSQTGLRIIASSRLQRLVENALALVGHGRTVRVRVRVVQPKVTTDQLARKYPYVITVDRPAFKLRLFKKLRISKTYRIAVGRIGLETPAGLYHVQNKAINPAWHVPNSAWAGKLAGKVIPGGTPENPLKSRWLGIFDGAGIHGTSDIASLGSAASHGCIRMAIPDVEELYDQVPLQTPVFIQ
jgi:lipoprotein-anchoring transpeptidase ErfK/SrfK